MPAGLEVGSDRPVFRQIADRLRAEIEAGAFAGDGRLPSETELMARFDVARMTVRQALALLKTEGLVVAEHGRGVFVRPRGPARRLTADRFARRAWSGAGAVGATDRLSVSAAVPPKRVAQALGLRSGAKAVDRTVRALIEGRPAELVASYVPASLARGTRLERDDLGPDEVLTAVEESGRRVARFAEEVSARMPTAEEARELGIPAGVPVLVVFRVVFDDAGAPVEARETVLPSEGLTLCYEASVD